MVFPVHLERSTVRAIMNCSVRGQFNASQSMRPGALQWICLIQESPSSKTSSGAAKWGMVMVRLVEVGLKPEKRACPPFAMSAVEPIA